MDHISRVKVFVEVVKQASFVGAGRELGLSGPAISKQIQALEASLGVKLLNRTTRHVSTTDEGAMYFERADKTLADLSEVEQQIQESRQCPTGRLKINAPMSFGNKFLAEPIAKFAKQYPDVELDVNFSDHWVDIVGEGYDLVIRIGVLSDSNLVARQLGTCPILPCATPAFINEHGWPQNPSEIIDLPAIVYSQHGQSEDWQYQNREDRTQGSVRLNRVMAASSGEVQLAACLQGVGLALMPIFLVAEALGTGALKQLLPDFETIPERGIYAMYPQNRFLATRVRLFLDWLLECSVDYPWQDQVR
jgi:DNA-binding transcriptional LysR family regulator